MIGFLLFEKYHQKKNTGSSRIRGYWLLKYMPEAELFVQGKDYEAVIYQKAYFKEHTRSFKGKKILDICDPDWLDGLEIVNFMKDVDAVTCPTEKLKEALSSFTDKPVYVIPDRIDFEIIPPPKKHEGKAKKCVWFGYSHNMEVLNPCLLKIKKMGLTLKVISDGNYMTSECTVENVKWDVETVDKEIQDADFALLPDKLDGRWVYKSPNKTWHCWAMGMPVAKTAADLERFMDGAERQKESEKKYQWAKENADVKLSAKELRDIIGSIKK